MLLSLRRIQAFLEAIDGMEEHLGPELDTGVTAILADEGEWTIFLIRRHMLSFPIVCLQWISLRIPWVWQKLESSLVDRTAAWIEMHASLLFSRSWRRYRTYVIHEHEVFDIKGLSTLPDRDQELEQVFVQLDVNPTPIHQASADPIKVPEALRDGPHDIWAYLDAKAIRSRHFVVTGAPGSGKTTLLKHLALSLARRRKAGVPRIPVLLYVRDHAATLAEKYDASTDTFAYSLAEAVNTHIQRKWQQALPLAWIKRKLAKGQCLVLLDGLDEVGDPLLRQLVVRWVQRQMLAYGQNRFILTSRPHGYRDNPLEGVWVLETRPFTPVQVAQFVQNWYQANEYKSWQKKLGWQTYLDRRRILEGEKRRI